MRTDELRAALEEGAVGRSENDFLCDFEFPGLEELDPSLGE